MIPALVGVGATLLLAIVGVVFQAGALREQVAALRVSVDNLAKALTRSAESQGRRIGNLESYLGLNADGIPVDRLGGFSGRVRAPGDNDGER